MVKAQHILVALACGLSAPTFSAAADVRAPSSEACAAARAAQSGLVEFPRSPNPLRIASARRGVHEFAIEVARAAPQRAQGLMFRCTLEEDAGMLFVFERPQRIGFYMRNTYLPLDVIYIAPNGTIDRIVTRRDVLSERIAYPHGPVQAVLEIAAGRAAALGIGVGDRVRHPLLR